MTLQLCEQELQQFVKLIVVKHDGKATHSIASALAQAKLSTSCKLQIDRIHQLVFVHEVGLAKNDETKTFEDLSANIEALLFDLRTSTLNT